MADGSVTFKDASGTSRTHDTRSALNGDLRPVVSLGNDGDLVAGFEPWGALQVNNGFQTLFYDSWSGTLDTSDKWTTSGTAPTISGGNMTMSSAAGYHSLRTRDLIKPNSGFTYVANGITLETTAATGAGRFWGLGTVASSPSATSLAQDGIGFEVDSATGALLAVTYSAGVRTTVATLPSGSAPTGTGANTSTTVVNFRDGATHRFACYFRVTGAQWFIDNLQVPVASVNFPAMTVVELPALISRFNGTIVGTPVFTNIAHLTADTSRPGVAVADAVVGTRVARVTDPDRFTAAPVVTGQGWGAALNVNPNAIQKRSYMASRVTADAGAPAAVVIVANTRKALMQVHHLSTATTTKRIRRIQVGALFGAAVQYGYEVYRVTAAPTGGTALTPVALDSGESASTLVSTYLPAAGVSGAIAGIPVAGATVLGAATGHGLVTVYDWQESGATKPLVIRAGVTEGYTLFVRGTGTSGPDPQIFIEFTEE